MPLGKLVYAKLLFFSMARVSILRALSKVRGSRHSSSTLELDTRKSFRPTSSLLSSTTA
jgi:hypothetical protein